MRRRGSRRAQAENGVIFSDGVEEDYVEFNAGAIATVGVAEKRLRLLVPN